MADRTIKRNNLTPALVIVARDAVGPADLEGVTAAFRMVNALTGLPKIDGEAASVAPNVEFTASGATLTAPNHPFNDDDSATAKSTGSLPGNLSLSQEYFVRSSTLNTLQLSLTKGGTPITTTSAGSGTHSLISGRITYEWQLGDTDTAGTFLGEIETTLNGKPLSYPNTRNFLIEVVGSAADAADRIVAIKAVWDLIQPDVEPKVTLGEVELEVDRAKLASYWTINTAYVIGNVIVVGNGHAYQVVQSGTSQSTVLSVNDWPVYSGALLGDGGSNPQLQWREIGTAQFNPGIAGAEYNVYDIERAAKALAKIKMRRAAHLIDAGDVSFKQMYEHWKEQAESFRPFRRQIELVRC